MLRRLLSLSLLILSVAPAAAEDHDHHVSELKDVRAVHAWTRATTEKTALVFVEIENKSGAEVLLTGGECDIAKSVELVGFQLKDGEPVYVALPSLPSKAGTEMVLAPNGLALRLNGLTQPLTEGSEVEMEIEFDIGHLEIHVEVEDADATQHSHAGHTH